MLCLLTASNCHVHCLSGCDLRGEGKCDSLCQTGYVLYAPETYSDSDSYTCKSMLPSDFVMYLRFTQTLIVRSMRVCIGTTRGVQKVRRLTQLRDTHVIFCQFSTYTRATEIDFGHSPFWPLTTLWNLILYIYCTYVPNLVQISRLLANFKVVDVDGLFLLPVLILITTQTPAPTHHI